MLGCATGGIQTADLQQQGRTAHPLGYVRVSVVLPLFINLFLPSFYFHFISFPFFFSVFCFLFFVFHFFLSFSSFIIILKFSFPLFQNICFSYFLNLNSFHFFYFSKMVLLLKWFDLKNSSDFSKWFIFLKMFQFKKIVPLFSKWFRFLENGSTFLKMVPF